MHDRVADVLAQRAAIGRGVSLGMALSVVLHAALAGAIVYAATHAPAPEPAQMVNIQFAKMPVPPAAPAARKPAAAPPAPKIEEPQPRIEEPKPQPKAEEPPPNPEKNTVPLSPFGRSTKKGSDTPPAPAPAPEPAGTPLPGGEVAVPIGGSGVTGLEGGDFPYALYIQGMHRKIGGNWVRPPIHGATVVIYFRILRDGTISEARVATPSGNGTFDRAALSAVRSSSPLNPLPFAYSGSYLGVHLAFR